MVQYIKDVGKSCQLSVVMSGLFVMSLLLCVRFYQLDAVVARVGTSGQADLHWLHHPSDDHHLHVLHPEEANLCNLLD